MSFRHVDCSKLLCVKKMFHFSFSCLSRKATTSERHQKKCQFFFFLSATQEKNIFQFSPAREIIHISIVIIAPRQKLCDAGVRRTISLKSRRWKRKSNDKVSTQFESESWARHPTQTRTKYHEKSSSTRLSCATHRHLFLHTSGQNFFPLRESRRRLANAAQPKSENCRDRERIFFLFPSFLFYFLFLVLNLR